MLRQLARRQGALGQVEHPQVGLRRLIMWWVVIMQRAMLRQQAQLHVAMQQVVLRQVAQQ